MPRVPAGVQEGRVLALRALKVGAVRAARRWQRAPGVPAVLGSNGMRPTARAVVVGVMALAIPVLALGMEACMAGAVRAVRARARPSVMARMEYWLRPTAVRGRFNRRVLIV